MMDEKMKIKCIRIYNEHQQESQSKGAWLTIGKEYVVLAIEVRQDKVSFLIASDYNEQPILQNAMQFEILTKTIPTTWQIAPGVIELFTVEPQSWSVPGFWEDCYDHEPKALEIYKREARIIMEEENAL
jgi:hypothetical protein